MSITEAHLVELQNYVSKYLYNRPGAQCIRHDILTKYLEDSHDESVIQKDKRCPRCFNVWNEGNFSVKIKAERPRSRSKKNIIIKCLICNKYCNVQHVTKNFRLEVRKTSQRQSKGESSDISLTNTEKRRKIFSKFSRNNEQNRTEGESADNSSTKTEKRRKMFSKFNRNNVQRRTEGESGDSLSTKTKKRRKMFSKFSCNKASNAGETKPKKRRKEALSILNDLL